MDKFDKIFNQAENIEKGLSRGYNGESYSKEKSSTLKNKSFRMNHSKTAEEDHWVNKNITMEIFPFTSEKNHKRKYSWVECWRYSKIIIVRKF